MDEIKKTTAGDVSHSVVKGVLGAIPFAGSLASELFGLIITPPLENENRIG